MIARTIYFWTCIDKLVGFSFEPLEEVQSFLIAKYAMVSPKCFDGAKGIAFPNNVICCHVPD